MTDRPGGPEEGPADAGGPEPGRATHWLVRIVERAGMASEEAVDLGADATTAEAWNVVQRRFSLGGDELARLVAMYFRLEVADLREADPAAALAIPESLARKHGIVPLLEDERHVWVATADPTDVDAERAVTFRTGRTAVYRVAPPGAIEDALDERYSPEKQVESLLGNLDGELEEAAGLTLIEETSPEQVSEHDVQTTPVVRLTNLIIRDGISAGASDIHVEPGRRLGVVRYRVDGVLRKHMDLPMSALNRVISRIKILAKLDIADRLRPQDGKARVGVGDATYDLRVSTIPAGGSEKCVIRILDSSASVTLDDLGLPEPERDRMRRLVTARDGLVVVTGPTGSGKTTTLYGALREIADGRINVMTVEDPIEYDLPAVTQTQVEYEQGLTFVRALRALLRQDPDVILVGEIRDEETAEVAAQAALTGHLVLATVHANDAVASVRRLADMGLRNGTIAQTLRGALAQRLLRAVCPACAEAVDDAPTPEEERLAERHGTAPAVRAVGCGECGFTGYRGRVPVVEVMTTGTRAARAIEEGKGWATLREIAIEAGMRTMHEVALEWVELGKTTLVEVERVLGQDISDEATDGSGGPTRILLVDDDDEARLLMRTLLEAEGFEVHEAPGGREALDRLRSDGRYSLCILDLLMPGLDGREVLRRIRGSVETAALPVMIRTGSGSGPVEAELLEAGADEYVDKSVDPARLVARVKAVVRRSGVP